MDSEDEDGVVSQELPQVPQEPAVCCAYQHLRVTVNTRIDTFNRHANALLAQR